jgi:hypothetical protein
MTIICRGYIEKLNNTFFFLQWKRKGDVQKEQELNNRIVVPKGPTFDTTHSFKRNVGNMLQAISIFKKIFGPDGSAPSHDGLTVQS